MPKRTIELGEETKKRRPRNKNTRSVRGVKIQNNPETVKVVTMRDKLVKNNSLKSSNERDLNKMSLDILNALGITIREDIPRNYSLLEQDTGKDLLDNPNIVDPSLKNLENKLHDPSNIEFPLKTDPFYELDDEPPRYMQDQRKVLKKDNEKKVTKFVADIFDLNSDIKNPTVKNLKQLAK